MRMTYGLNLEQTQKLVMTPELRQAITILQLSSLELEMYIDQQLQENPLLDIKEEGDEKELVSGEEIPKDKDQVDKQREFDLDWEDYFQDSSDLGLSRQGAGTEYTEYTYENFLSQVPTLVEHLMFQLSLSSLDDKEKKIGEYLIGNIDGHGYLQTSLAEAAGHLNTTPEKAEKVLAVIQLFDPPGVGARSLEECLLIQLDLRAEKDTRIRQVVRDHLGDLAKGKISHIAQVLGVSPLDVQCMADIIKTLDPKPGRNFSNPNDTRYITPDIVVEKVEGEYIILVNDTFIPRLTINSSYRSVLKQERDHDAKTRRFVENKLNAAVWLLRSIEQRRMTLYKVAGCLVDLQQEFLERGVKCLKPLNLKKVAEIVGLHESTVSRATSNKYIQTPQGLFEMKFFFSTGLSGSEGTATSSESIKKMLQEIIQSEDSHNPLNDQEIAGIFSSRGITISRRTVAKYRDELGIQPIRKRKRY